MPSLPPHPGVRVPIVKKHGQSDLDLWDLAPDADPDDKATAVVLLADGTMESWWFDAHNLDVLESQLPPGARVRFITASPNNQDPK